MFPKLIQSIYHDIVSMDSYDETDSRASSSMDIGGNHKEQYDGKADPV